MELDLAPGVHAVRIGDDVVFLDVGADAYYAVADAGGDLTVDRAHRRLRVGCETLGQSFVGSGLARLPDGRALLGEPLPLHPLRSRGCDRAVIGASDVVRFAAASFRARRRMARGSFAVLVAEASGRGSPAVADEETLRLARIFPHLLIWSPWTGECLFRSYLLLTFLRAHDRDAAWIFGVRTWPFAAHCWLQVGDQVLDDAPERLTAYTPILQA